MGGAPPYHDKEMLISLSIPLSLLLLCIYREKKDCGRSVASGALCEPYGLDSAACLEGPKYFGGLCARNILRLIVMGAWLLRALNSATRVPCGQVASCLHFILRELRVPCPRVSGLRFPRHGFAGGGNWPRSTIGGGTAGQSLPTNRNTEAISIRCRDRDRRLV